MAGLRLYSIVFIALLFVIPTAALVGFGLLGSRPSVRPQG